jgi:hypoxanthine phosphoribosyltransferase
MFMADLLRRIPLPVRLDCLSVASYHGKAQRSGEVIFKQVALPDVAGRDVLILDDILDSGHTLAAIRDKLEATNPRSIRVCVLLQRKQRARASNRIMLGLKSKMNLSSVTAHYGCYRNLPYIGVLRKELLQQC